MIAYERVGDGPSHVVVLHGWFGDHGIWKAVYPLLDTGRFSYVFVDYRGYGASRDLAGPHTMAQISADVRELTAHLGWTQYAVVGHSMGGMAAQRLAIDAPDAVSAVIGVTPVPASGVPLPPEVLALFESAARDDAAAAGVVEGSLGQRLTPALTRWILAMKRETVAPDSGPSGDRDRGLPHAACGAAQALKGPPCRAPAWCGAPRPSCACWPRSAARVRR